MRIESTDNKTFQLTDDGLLLGELVYKSLFSYNATLSMSDSDAYHIKPVGFFGTSITVTKDETEIAKLVMNWKGQIVITFPDDQEFVLKGKGLFHNKFVLENKEEEELIQFDPKFNWGKFNYSYDISYNNKPQDILLVLLAAYACNYYIAVVSGAM